MGCGEWLLAGCVRLRAFVAVVRERRWGQFLDEGDGEGGQVTTSSMRSHAPKASCSRPRFPCPSTSTLRRAASGWRRHAWPGRVLAHACACMDTAPRTALHPLPLPAPLLSCGLPANFSTEQSLSPYLWVQTFGVMPRDFISAKRASALSSVPYLT